MKRFVLSSIHRISSANTTQQLSFIRFGKKIVICYQDQKVTFFCTKRSYFWLRPEITTNRYRKKNTLRLRCKFLNWKNFSNRSIALVLKFIACACIATRDRNRNLFRFGYWFLRGPRFSYGFSKALNSVSVS